MTAFRALTTPEILAELGRRLRRLRLEADIGQAELARQAGLSERTVRNLEAGSDSQLSTLIQVLRVLHRIDELAVLVPEPSVSPMELLRRAGKPRRRASRGDG